MITLEDVLTPKFVDLEVKATNLQEAILHVASLLKGDERVLDWPKLYAGVLQRNPCVAGGCDFDISIPHARTDAVSTMVMAVGRSADGLAFPDSEAKVHYVFVIGVPVPLAADYLRIVGALARIFRNVESEQKLRQMASPAEFIRYLVAHEIHH
jgi:mannitol/fructose-specific phosphotransferase system IIA component (Ntr-type)